MNLIASIKLKFDVINENMKTKKNLIRTKFDNDFKSINVQFGLDKEADIKDKLNDEREILLKKLNVSKIYLMEMVNAIYSMTEPPEFETKLTKLKARIKEYLLFFDKNNSIEFTKLLIKHKFKHDSGLARLNKYQELQLTKKRVNFKLPNGYNYADLTPGKTYGIINLDYNRILIYIQALDDDSDDMLIINSKGEKLYSKSSVRKEGQCKSIKASGSSIIILNQFDNETVCSFVEIYNFKLCLITSFNIKNSYLDEFVVNNNEIAFQNVNAQKLLVLNLDFLKLININVKEKGSLVHLNNNKFYLSKYDSQNGYNIILVCDRLTNESKILPFRLSSPLYLKFDSNSRILLFDIKKLRINIYSCDGILEKNLSFNGEFILYAYIRFTYWDTAIYNIKFNKEYIEYDEY